MSSLHWLICRMILTWFEFVNFSENLDAIALKKLVNFVNDLMERYFSFVQRRIQLEVWCLAIVQLIRWYIVHSEDLLSLRHFHDFVKLLFVSVRQETTLSWWDLWTDSIVACRPWTSSYLTQISLGKEKLKLKLRHRGIWSDHNNSMGMWLNVWYNSKWASYCIGFGTYMYKNDVNFLLLKGDSAKFWIHLAW